MQREVDEKDIPFFFFKYIVPAYCVYLFYLNKNII